MSSYSVQFSTKINGRKRVYPHNLNGQSGNSVSGVDPGAVRTLRSAQKGDKFVVTQAIARKIATAVKDGARVSPFEKPVHFALLSAIDGKTVLATDKTVHYRALTMTDAAGRAYLKSMTGIKIQKV